MAKYWVQSVDSVLADLGGDAENGLSHDQVAKRLAQCGPNKLPARKSIPAWRIFISQFSSLIVWVLIAAAAIAALLGEWIDSGAIMAITVVNTLLGFFQEWRSVRTMEALVQTAHQTCTVKRDGQLQTISAEAVVPGDWLLVEAGDQIPADGRIMSCYQLRTQEAALTGESLAAEKTSEQLDDEALVAGDRRNMVFLGTTAVYGKAFVLVTETGLHTEMGKLAQLLDSVEGRDTPLQKSLARLGRRLIYLCIAVVAFIAMVGYLRGVPAYTLVMTSLSLAVAAIPEGLPAAVTIALAVGMQRMAKRNALIRELSAVETLGCTTVICTDKTGTLTENTMRVRMLWVDGRQIAMGGQGYVPEGEFSEGDKSISPCEDEPLALLLRTGGLCNSAGLSKLDGVWQITGDPTEAALIVAAEQAGVRVDRSRISAELPFDSERRLMSVVADDTLYAKGAPDSIMAKCRELPEGIQAVVDELASQGLRVLAMASRPMAPSERLTAEVEKNLTLVGLMAMRDPPRQAAKDAIARCVRAGIRPIIVTGDHAQTAAAVAKELEMAGADQVVEGSQLCKLSTKEIAENFTVFARVSGADKVDIVTAFQEHGQIVAMTGDGVNDAPAIEKADIGVSMGITGTDVTKSTSDMVILDDNFESIVEAVREGRGVYDNIVKFASYLLSCNVAEVLLVFIGLFLLGGNAETAIILAPIHLLWVNLVTDGLPAIALAFDPIAPDAMRRPPRNPNAALLTRPWLLLLAVVSGLICALSLAVFLLVGRNTPELARTAAFSSLVCLELIKPLLLHRAFGLPIFRNGILQLAIALSMSLQLAVIYVPMFQTPMHTQALGLAEWGWIALAGAILWVVGSGLTSKTLEKGLECGDLHSALTLGRLITAFKYLELLAKSSK